MATVLLPSSAVPSLQSPVLHAQSSPESAAWDHLRWPTLKRRVTAPPDLQTAKTGCQGSKKTRYIPENGREEVHIVDDDVEDLLPKFHSMGKDASLYTPQSSAFDTTFVPFVFDDGVLSFHLPSPDSSDSGPSASPPASAASNASFLGVLPNEPRSAKQPVTPVLQGLSIWQGDAESPAHVYAQTLNDVPTYARETVNIDDLDPALTHYRPVHAAMAQLPCHFMHVRIPLTVPPIATLDDSHHATSSKVTISTTRRGPIHVTTALYHEGTFLSSYEAQMKEDPDVDSGGTSYSTCLPEEFVDVLCNDLERSTEVKRTPLDGPSPRKNVMDSVAIMRFIQLDEKSSSGGIPEGDVVLAVVCDFRATRGPLPGDVKVSHLSPGNKPLRELRSTTYTPPSPPSSREHFASLKALMPSHLARRTRASNRPPPKLSVAIPPPTIHSTKGRIQLCNDHPGLTPDSCISRPTPQTGVPQNVFPMTPFEQLTRTPLHPPETLRGPNRSRAGIRRYMPTPSESAYPFTLASSSPSNLQSPAFAVLDSASYRGSFASGWVTLPRNTTPLTPSFFIQPNTSAAASNTMTSMTQRALDAGTPNFTIPRRGEYFEQQLTSIVSSPPPTFAQAMSTSAAPTGSCRPSLTLHALAS